MPTVKALVIGGGGGGGADMGGGGGSGEFNYDPALAVTAQAYSVTVGAGGAGSSSTANKGTSGADSIFSTITSSGGGGGGSGGNRNGVDGGSGGGGGANGGQGSGGQGSQTGGADGDGGTSASGGSGNDGSGGGGGASANGANGTGDSGGNGGAGTANSISGSSVTYAGGGGGAARSSVAGTAGTGGAGGGGDGGKTGAGTAGTANTGGGGGGASGTAGSGGAGGSGVVIISYVTADFGECTGGTITTDGANTVHTFTTSGTFTVVEEGLPRHNRQCEVVIQSSQVGSTLTDYVLLCTPSNLPSEMFDADGSFPAQSNGGDIRFSSDSSGNTQLACQVVTFLTDNNPANGKAEIYVKVPSVSSSVDTTIYVWYNTAETDTQPVASSPYGSENVWTSSYASVHHFQEAVNTTSDGYKDSTSNANHGTGVSTTLTEVDGKWGGKAIDIDGSADYVTINGLVSTLASSNSGHIQFWAKSDADNGLINYLLCISNGADATVTELTYSWDYGASRDYIAHDAREDGATSNTVRSPVDSLDSGVTTWTKWELVQTGSAIAYYKNGSSITATDAAGGDNGAWFDTIFTDATTKATQFILGAFKRNGAASNFWDGKIDELRVFKGTRSDDYRSAEYINENTPGTFAIAGTPATPASGNTSFLLFF